MAELSVNVDHVATIREARKTNVPDPVAAAVLVELAGADGITIHLREDRRHIQDRDLKLMRQMVKTRLNLEMAATKEMVLIALDTKPDKVSLVPEKREEITTEGGLDVIKHKNQLKNVIRKFHDQKIPVSLFIDPELAQVECSKTIGGDAIEINTGKYSELKTDSEIAKEFKKIQDAVDAAVKLGLNVNAGHGLTYKNVAKIASIQAIEEFNIGHNIVARAVMVGLDKAVKEMIEAINQRA
ncbi:MAG TPA: pyridoxine 5'-phosphate synthase [Nitrospinota bacterium]|jgi:pyridoxine 5-phosphate synthase|nr:pyridoxine 5'-phosphate synthase [Nitrospinota bacterium]HJN02245.1 pyridoxine 5'-phosphate synthase [Nitrospinota bacterium]|tara:strand:- start:329 stop:1051 length:723 start_codon:yes stop_codon:yes gene_type:complete